jgi:hypothetical protein
VSNLCENQPTPHITLVHFPLLPKPRHLQKKILDHKRMKVDNKSTSITRCGHFDEKYIETLKGIDYTLNFTNSYLFYSIITLS